MPRKRKRNIDPGVEARNHKRYKISSQDTTTKHPILLLYYPKVSSLREYLLSRFPKSAKSRRKRIDSVVQWPPNAGSGLSNDCITSASTAPGNVDLSKLLDTTIVGYGANPQQLGPSLQQQRDVDMLSQKLHSSAKSDSGNAGITQHEVCSSALELFLLSMRRWRSMKRC